MHKCICTNLNGGWSYVSATGTVSRVRSLTVHERRSSNLVLGRATDEDGRIPGYNQTDHEYTAHVEDRNSNKGYAKYECIPEVWPHETHCGERLMTNE